MKKLLATGVVLAAFATVLAVSVQALFTDSQSVPANTFTSGTVDISTSPTSALVTFANMAPGDQVTNPITVSNAGTLDLRYAISSTTTENVLAGQLDLTIKTGATTCTNVGFSVDGAVIYGAADVGNTTPINVVGDPATGAQAGDRALTASTNEILCFNVALPTGATNAAQGITSTATFDFQAEQTKNN